VREVISKQCARTLFQPEEVPNRDIFERKALMKPQSNAALDWVNASTGIRTCTFPAR
jgi:hypothetical protein